MFENHPFEHVGGPSLSVNDIFDSEHRALQVLNHLAV
jgi:hypothetical protein